MLSLLAPKPWVQVVVTNQLSHNPPLALILVLQLKVLEEVVAEGVVEMVVVLVGKVRQTCYRIRRSRRP